jgi:hypothetical protein
MKAPAATQAETAPRTTARAQPGFLGGAVAIAAKDLRSELRTKEALNASLAFSVVILLLFSFAFDPTAEETRALAGGLLWLVFAFAGALILNSQLRPRAAQRLSGCADRGADLRPGALSGKGGGELVAADGGGAGQPRGFRHFL